MRAPPAAPITSPANPRVKQLVLLQERQARDDSGLFLVAGYRELRRALAGGVPADRACTAAPPLYLGQNEEGLVEAAARAGAEVIPVAEAPFRRASYRDRPEGLLALPDPLLLVVEAIEKPGNLGTMLRTAEAAGAAAVVVCDPATDPFNPNVAPPAFKAPARTDPDPGPRLPRLTPSPPGPGLALHGSGRYANTSRDRHVADHPCQGGHLLPSVPFARRATRRPAVWIGHAGPEATSCRAARDVEPGEVDAVAARGG